MIWNRWLTYATNLGVEDLDLSILYIDSFCAWLYYLVVLHLVFQTVWFGIHSPLIHTLVLLMEFNSFFHSQPVLLKHTDGILSTN